MDLRRRTALAMAFVVFLTDHCLGDAVGSAPRLYSLHIESQPLAEALLDFARQTDIQILIFSRLAEGLHSPALDGTYTVDAAMAAMLSRSSLTYRSINARTIEIIRRRATARRRLCTEDRCRSLQPIEAARDVR